MAQTAPQYLTTRDLANMTGLSADYFQKKARNGNLPAMRLGDGPRAPYMIEKQDFEKWWEKTLRKVEPWQSGKEARSGGPASNSKGRRLKDRSKQSLKQWRESAKKDI